GIAIVIQDFDQTPVSGRYGGGGGSALTISGGTLAPKTSGATTLEWGLWGGGGLITSVCWRRVLPPRTATALLVRGSTDRHPMWCRAGAGHGIRFDQYDQPENRLTHALAVCLYEDRGLLQEFLAWDLCGSMRRYGPIFDAPR